MIWDLNANSKRSKVTKCQDNQMGGGNLTLQGVNQI